mmetsp:Transcript_5256/g.9187  ORF Transcript_5256/g.9187 Transcript_5256/m.9187 type:complete len:184 (-) Transcript_5256:178-729(-)
MAGRGERASSLLAPSSTLRSLSPYAQKLTAQIVVWTASTVVWGATLDEMLREPIECNSWCIANYVFGGGSFIYLSLILLFNYLCEVEKMRRDGWFKYIVELYMMYALTIWWVVGVSIASDVDNNLSSTAEVLAYFALFGSMVCAFAAYRTFRAEEARLDALRQLEEEEQSQILSRADFGADQA